MSASLPRSFLATAMAAAVFTGAATLSAQSKPASGPRTMQIVVERDVSLEVIDWGGNGRPVVLLAGNTQTAHSFSEFAPQLAQHYHVYGITRRGWGASSHPATGYTASRLADDVIAVIDSLKLTKPVLAGHSRAGQELSSIAGRHPQKVSGLVYLDGGYNYAAYDPALGDYAIDVAELKRRLDALQDVSAQGNHRAMDSVLTRLLTQDVPMLQRDLQRMQQTLPTFPSGVQLMPPRQTGIAQAGADGLERHTEFHSPILAIFNGTGAPQGVGTDTAITKAWLARDNGPAARFSRIVPSARVLMLPNATHFVFDSNPREVIAAMREFIDALPVSR